MNKEPESTTPTETETHCRCGYGRNHPILASRGHYTPFGWILWLTGISSCPTKVDIVCPVCGFIFETITDPEQCKRYRYR